MKSGFDYSIVPIIERLLIENILGAIHTLTYERSTTHSQLLHWERRLTASQHRYLSSIESLA